MCQKFKNVFKCGHQDGAAWFQPERPKDCDDAKRANRHDAHRRLLRCTARSGNLSTVVIASRDTVCDKSTCYANEYLIPVGWQCHSCGGCNPRNSRQCTWQGCEHEPCRWCHQYPDRGGSGGGGSGAGGSGAGGSGAGGSGAAGDQSGGYYGYGGGQGSSGYGQQYAGAQYDYYGSSHGGHYQGYDYRSAGSQGRSSARPSPGPTRQDVKTPGRPREPRGASSTGKRAERPTVVPEKTHRHTSSTSAHKSTQDRHVQSVTGKLAGMSIGSSTSGKKKSSRH